MIVKEFHGKTAVWLAAFALALAATGGAWGQGGARPMAMGGAFVGLADDVSAAHYNPAGLVQLRTGGATLAYTATDPDKISHLNSLSVAGPISPKAAAAVSLVKIKVPIFWKDDLVQCDAQDWVWVSFAAKTGPRSSIGLNVKHIARSAWGMRSDLGLDIGFFGRAKERWSYGLLIESLNEQGLRWEGERLGRQVRCWRAGAAYRRDKMSVITAELLVVDHGLARGLALGYEKQLKGGWAVRCGGWWISNINIQAVTLGCGKVVGGPKSKTSLDVAAAIGDSDRIVVSVSRNF